MPPRLLKVAAEAQATTTVKPNVQKFFYVTTTQIPSGGTLTITADQFFDDDGEPISELPEIDNDNSYLVVSLNGIVQMSGLYTYTSGPTGSLVIQLSENDEPIIIGTVVTLRIVTFEPETDVTIQT